MRSKKHIMFQQLVLFKVLILSCSFQRTLEGISETVKERKKERTDFPYDILDPKKISNYMLN